MKDCFEESEMKTSLRIKGDQLSIENEVALEQGERRYNTREKRLLSTFLWRENSETSRPRFATMQR